MERDGDRSWPDKQLSEFLDQISSGGEDYRRLVERLPAIVYTSELGEHGRWRYVSPQVEEILGYSPEEFERDPEPVGATAAPRRSRARACPGDRGDARRAQPAAGRLPDDHPRRRRRLDARRGGARGRRGRRAGLAWRPLRHHRAQDRRAGAAARGRPAGGGRAARRASAAGRRPRRADAGRGLADGGIDGVQSACIWEPGRDGRRLRLRAGLEGQASGGEPARLGGHGLPRRRRARLGPPRDRRRLVQRASLHDAAGAARARGRAAASR